MEFAVLEDITQGEMNWILPSFEFNSLLIFTTNPQIPHCIRDLVPFLEPGISCLGIVASMC